MSPKLVTDESLPPTTPSGFSKGNLKSVPYYNAALSFQQKSLVIILSSGARVLLEVISVRPINSISLYTSQPKAVK